MGQPLYPAPLDPTLAWESAGIFTVGSNPLTAAVFQNFVTGAPAGYWRLGNGTRWKWNNVSATYMEVDAFSTGYNPIGGIGIIVNDGATLWPMYGPSLQTNGARTLKFFLPPGYAKTVELLVPSQAAVSQHTFPEATYPYAVRFNSPATPVAPPSPTRRLGFFGDSVSSGGLAISPALLGFTGLMKMGLSAQYGSNWMGAYNAGTTYQIGNFVSNANWVWQALTVNIGVTPAAGAHWKLIGYDGTVSVSSYGFRELNDDASTGGQRTALAAAIAALGLTKLVLFIGSNDQAFSVWNLASFQAAFSALITALQSAQPSLTYVIISPLLRNNPEVANGFGETLAQYRTALSGIASGASIPYINGGTALAYSDLGVDVTHPTTAGNRKLMGVLQASGFL